VQNVPIIFSVSVRPQGTTQKLLNRFSRNLVLGDLQNFVSALQAWLNQTTITSILHEVWE
jgi:hypothetical protein